MLANVEQVTQSDDTFLIVLTSEERLKFSQSDLAFLTEEGNNSGFNFLVTSMHLNGVY